VKEPRRLLQVTNSSLERELLESGIVEHPSALSLERTLARVTKGSMCRQRSMPRKEPAALSRYDSRMARPRRSHWQRSATRSREETRPAKTPRGKPWALWLLFAVVSFASGTAVSWAWG
jgi:hypothetical protein